jgi:uncharacterized protein (TIGR02996 family)
MDFLGDPKGGRLFDQVVAAPASMAPRAVLADWLLERGDPLGEFIALQLKRPGSKREVALRRAHEADWLGPIHAIADGQSITFHRGFLASLHLEASYWPDRAFLKDLRAATGHPALSLVTSLTLGKGVGEGGTWSEGGHIMNPPGRSGRAIPIVAFLAHHVFDRLKSVQARDEFSEPVLEALTKFRPDVDLSNSR